MQKAAIIYLTRQNDLWVFVFSIRLLLRNFGCKHQYPIIVFHDDINDTQINHILKSISDEFGYSPNIKFERIFFTLPEDVSTDPSLFTNPQGHPIGLNNFPIGYRHMCRFYSGQVMNHPALKEYRYVWRMDSDSFILSHINTDPFQVMFDREYIYTDFGTTPIEGSDGWKYAGKEIEWAREGLFEATLEYAKKNINLIKNPITAYEGELYNSNVEIMDMDFFRSHEYTSYFEDIDKHRNFYYKRWGDHCFRWLGLRLFSSPDKIWFAQPSIGYCYQHGSLINGIEHIDMECLNHIPDVFRKIVESKISQGTLNG